MSKESKLVKQTAIYAVGNLGSKVLTYVMVLVYTYFITPEEMGFYDLVITSISMLQPLILLQINDGIYRFLVDGDRENQTLLIGSGVRFLCITTAAAEILFAVFCSFFNLQYAVWIGLMLASTMFLELFHNVVRGLGQSKFYAGIGLLNSFLMLLFETVGLMVLNLGVMALIASKFLANAVCIAVMLIRQPIIRSSLKHPIHKEVLKPVIRYSVPLVPNTICWWVINSSDRYLILGFLGEAFNGVYSMATKFPTVLTTITSIFYLAWQESAIKEYHSPNRDEFFSSIFRRYYVLLFTLAICAFPATRFVIALFVSADYRSAWQYTGFLYLAAVFSALSGFLGLGYQISKETARSFATTVFAAILNFGINIGCIRFVGLQAASFSTFAAYMFLMLIRLKHAKRYFTLKIQWGEFTALFASVLLVMYLTFVVSNLWLCAVMELVAVAVFVKMNYAIIRLYIQNLIRKVKQ